MKSSFSPPAAETAKHSATFVLVGVITSIYDAGKNSVYTLRVNNSSDGKYYDTFEVSYLKGYAIEGDTVIADGRIVSYFDKCANRVRHRFWAEHFHRVEAVQTQGKMVIVRKVKR